MNYWRTPCASMKAASNVDVCHLWLACQWGMQDAERGWLTEDVSPLGG